MLQEPNGLDAAFRAVFEAELPYVVRTLRRLGAAEREVPDLAQDVFITVHRRFGEYDRTRPIRPWLFAFAYRVAQNHKRLVRHDRETLGRDVEAYGGEAGSDPHAKAETAERRELLLRALEKIPFDRRVVLGDARPRRAECKGDRSGGGRSRQYRLCAASDRAR